MNPMGNDQPNGTVCREVAYTLLKEIGKGGVSMHKIDRLDLIPHSDEQRLIKAVKNMERHGDLSCLAALERLLPDATVTSRYYIQRAIRGVRRRHNLPDVESTLLDRKNALKPAMQGVREKNAFSTQEETAASPSDGPTASRADFARLDLSVGLLRRLERVLSAIA